MWRGAEENITLAVLELLPDRHAYLVINCIVFIVFTCNYNYVLYYSYIHAYTAHACIMHGACTMHVPCMSISCLRHAFDMKHVSSLHEKCPKFILFHETCMYFNMKACISMHVTVCMF